MLFFILYFAFSSIKQTKDNAIVCPYGAEEVNGECVCLNGRGYDPIINKCIKCKKGYCVNSTDKHCIELPLGEGILQNGECGFCPEGQGVDNETKKCKECDANQGILPFTNICGQCPEHSTFNKNNKKCECDIGFYITKEDTCEKCPFDQTTDPNDKTKCSKCSENYCLDNDSKQCISIQDNLNKAINPENGLCIECPSGSTKVSGRCQCNIEGQGFNSDYTECNSCQEYEYINQNGKCTKCSIYECFNETSQKCITLDSTLFKNKDNGKCEVECNDVYHPFARVCGVCPEGATPKEGKKECKCENGQAIYEIDGEFKCTICPNFYGFYTNENYCRKCNKGYCVSEEGHCKPLYYDNYMFENGTCVDHCPLYYVSNGTRVCEKCALNKCLANYGRECRDLYENEYISALVQSCSCLPFHGYVDENGNTKCTPCKSGECVLDGKCVNMETNEKANFIDENGQCLEYCDRRYNLITNICGECPKGGRGSSNRYCECKTPDEYVTPDNKCEICPLGQIHHRENFTCGECPYGQGINPDGIFCTTPKIFEGIEKVTRYIIRCKPGECIEPNSRECIPIPENESISPIDGTCVTCPSTSIIDNETRCICQTGFGYKDELGTCQECENGIDPETYMCTNCLEKNLGIDHDTRFCRRCSVGEGIDLDTHECSSCPYGLLPEIETPMCSCPPLQGFDIETKKCVQCKENEGINFYTKECGKCETGFGINPETRICVLCPHMQGIDPITGMCRECPIKEGIDPITKICGPCKDGEGINRVNGTCQKCHKSQIIDNETLKCSCDGNSRFDTLFGCISENCALSDDQMACINCEEIGMYHNKTTMKCQECPPDSYMFKKECKHKSEMENYCIYKNQWYLSSAFLNKDDETSACICINGEMLDSSNVNPLYCRKCKDDEGVDPISHNCTFCNNKNGEAIDPNTRFCRKRVNDVEGINPVSLTWDQSVQDAIVVDNFWKCLDGLGFDSKGQKCIECPTDAKYLHNYTNHCTPCKDYDSSIDSVTQTCTCKKRHGISYSKVDDCSSCSFYEGIDPINLHCRKCNLYEFEGIDPETRLCRNCTGNDEGLVHSTGECVKLPKGAIFDEATHTFKCPYNQGYDPSTYQCIDCRTKMSGIDPETGECVECNYMHGIDDFSGFCTNCKVKGMCISRETGICRPIKTGEKSEFTYSYHCECENGYSRDDDKCTFCSLNEGSDWEKCQVCEKGKGINRWTFQCEKCREGLGINRTDYRCGKCAKGEGIDKETRFCGPCKEGEGIDKVTKECIVCPKSQTIDPETNYCVCPNKQTYDPNNDACVTCPKGQGIDPNTFKCTNYESTQCINLSNGEITVPVSIQIRDSDGYCICPGGLSFNLKTNKCEFCPKRSILHQDTNVCEECPEGHAIDPENPMTCKYINTMNHEGIDSETKMWTVCKDDQGIDIMNNECVECPLFAKINTTNFRCECDEGFGIDEYSWTCVKCTGNDAINKITKRCEPCQAWQGIDENTGECVPCPPYQGIDIITGHCVNCSFGFGIDSQTGKCVQCPSNQGINPDTLKCDFCPSNFGIDPVSKYCVKCNPGEVVKNYICSKCDDGYGYDSNKNICKLCSDTNCSLCTNDYNVCTACKEQYKVENGKCVPKTSEIPGEVVTPTEAPVIIVDAEIVEINGKYEIKEKPDIQGNICNVNIKDNLNGKTIVINDKGQAQTQVNFDGNVEKVIIEQNSGKKLDINTISEKPVTVTIKNPKLISIKGKGQLYIEDQDKSKQIVLESLVPTTNNDLAIKSDSQIIAKRLELSGNSNIKFDSSNGATVEVVNVQQKAETILENVEIGKTLNAGNQASITIGENVKISAAQIELSDSDNAQASAVIKGMLGESPNQISIKNSINNKILEDANQFIIAESDNEAFKCNDWVNSFDTKSNPKYTHATCTKDENSGVVKLVADNNKEKSKKGLKPGVIAAIVIAVVVVIAVVIVLIWFFVFRKKNKANSRDENSLFEEM